MRKLLAIAVLFFSCSAFAQLGNVVLKIFPGAPTGPCTSKQQAVNAATGDLYVCKNGSWFKVGPGAAGSAAFSSLTPGTNSSAGNFIASANTWDFTAATIKVPTKTQADNTTNAASTAYVDAGLAGKQNSLGFTPVANTTTVAGHALSSNVTIACADLSNGAAGCSMSTTAGGDLSGTLPSPTVAKINGNSVPSGAAADQLLVGTAANTFSLKTLTDTSGGASAVTYATSGHTFGVLSNILTASLTSTRIPFSSSTNALVDSANLTYAANSGLSQVQGANNTDMFYAKRFTDTTPTGNFLHFQNAAASVDLFKLDVLGNLTATSFQATNPSGNAGMLSLIQGTAPSAVANAVNFLAPTSVTTYTETLPGTVAAGLWAQDASGNISFGPLSGDVTTSLLTATVAKVHGVTYAATPSTDTTPVITASNTATYTSLPNCGDATHAISYATSTHLFGCQAITATAAPAGSDTQVQYNNSAALGASAAFTFNKTDTLTIGLAGTTLGKLAMAGNTSGATTLVGAAAGGGTWTLRNTTDNVVGAATNDTLTNKTINASNNTISNLTGAMMTNATVTATQLAAQYSRGSCTEVWGGTGAANALSSGDDAIMNNACFNDTGVTRTITAVKCRSDSASNTTTVNPTFGASGTGTAILSGALTCGSSLAYSSTGTVTNASWTTGTGINPVQGGTLTGTSIAVIVEFTY